MTNTVSMDRALKDPKLSDAEREKLLWVQQVREYAAGRLGLKAGRSYLSFYNTGGGPAVYNLSASRRDALQPYSWSFPIVGKFEYLGYFDKAMAKKDAARLEKEGYDTVIYPSPAYSTAGWFADPLFSSLLDMDKPQLANTVIHELAHNTVFMKDDSDFTESVANFVGTKGALEFIVSVAGKNSDLYRQTIQSAEDRKLLNEFLDGVYRDLSGFYGRKDLTSQQKIAGRATVFMAQREKFKTNYLSRFRHPEMMKRCGDLSVNNAWILLNRRYNYRLDLFEKVYQASNRDLKRTISVFMGATASQNGWKYLQNWLDSQAKSGLKSR